MVLFTIGYEGLEQTAFLAWLKRFHVDVVADVRNIPLSRKNGFSKNSLKDALATKSIDYYNYPELGAPKSIRNELVKTGDYKTFFKKYKKAISNKKELMDKILHIISEGRIVALLCFENDAQKCHRTVLASVLKKRSGNGLIIEHIKAW